MGAQLRVYRRRIRTVRSTAKITRAMELIAASRVVRAQQRVAASTPYADELTHAVSAVASLDEVDHPLTTARENPRRAAVLLLTSDRGLAGAYSSNVLKEGESLVALLRERGLEVAPYIVGRKGIGFYRFRQRPVVAEWSGFTEKPTYADAKAIADVLLPAFAAGSAGEGGAEGSAASTAASTAAGGDVEGVDEIHIVHTHYVSMLTQEPVVRRLLPLEVEVVEEAPPGGAFPLYDFEPDAEGVLDALLPRYIESRIYNALLQAAASELAARQRAMKSATDNAEELTRTYTRLANQARQAEITQEISEIVGGADALAAASAGNE